MGSRSRKRARAAGGKAARTSTTDYRDPDGNVLTLRDELSPGTLAQLARLDATPAASAEDRWQRRAEFLFERLAVRWELAGLPLESQKELLGRYRMASSDERRWVRQTLDEHLSEKNLPEASLLGGAQHRLGDLRPRGLADVPAGGGQQVRRVLHRARSAAERRRRTPSPGGRRPASRARAAGSRRSHGRSARRGGAGGRRQALRARSRQA